MIKCFSSCLTRLIANREGSVSRGRRLASHPISCVLSLGSWIYASSAQTPVFKGEKRDYLKEIKEIVSSLLGSQTFLLAVLGIGIVIGLVVLYNRRKDISELGLQVIEDDTWFITRDDNNRVGIFVSVTLSNKATRGVSVVNCKLSGYSAKEQPEEIQLVGPEGEQKLNFPEHKHFHRGQDFYLGPYSTENLWFYYESRTVTMRNLLQAPLTIRDSDKKRKTVRVRIPRHADQIAIYREMAKIW
jgi:hypothetical protein